MIVSFNDFLKQSGGTAESIKSNTTTATNTQAKASVMSQMGNSELPKTPGYREDTTQFKGIEKVANTLNDFIGVGDLAAKGGEKILNYLSEKRPNDEILKKAALSGRQTAPTSEQTAAAGLKALSTAAAPFTGGSSLAGRLAVGAGTGYAQDVANNITETGFTEESLTPGVGAAIGSLPLAGLALKNAPKIISGTISGTGKGLKSVGKKVYSSAYTPNVKEAESILAYEASKPATFSKLYGTNALQGNAAFKPITTAETALRGGIAGTETNIGIQAKRLADTIYNKEISPAVKSIKEVITKDDLFNPLKENIEKIIDPSKRKAYQNAFESLAEDYNEIKSFTYEEAQKLKSELAQFTPAKVFRGQDVANETRMLQADIADTIRKKTYQALKDINVKEKYIDYGNLQELQKVGIKAISESKLKGGFGGFWSALYDTAMTPVKTVGGKVLYKIGDKLQVKAPKGFENEPLSKYLKSVGYLAPQTVNELQN